MFDSQGASVQQPESGNSQCAAQSPDVSHRRRCGNSKPHLKRAREAAVRYTTSFIVRGTAVLHPGHDPAAGDQRHQSARLLANQTVTPQMRLPRTALWGRGPSFLGGFKRHARPQTKVGRTSETFWTTEFARAREIKPRLDDWKRELALFTLVQRERCYPTTYLDGNETAQPGCWTRSTAGYWSQGLAFAG